ncbi:MAG: amino acid adenylation domain-containing protein [Lachnospiraceae bacterium]|nr:amino acid adenylation domain-containing protein [Lachnospiraceae bacterium]
MDYYHLTTPQQNIWNLQKYYEGTAISNLCGAIFYNEKRSSDLLQQAICQFVMSQSGIRLRFQESGEPKQYVYDEADKAISVLNFDTMEEFHGYAEAFAKEPLGLTERQMYRFVVAQIGEKSSILVKLSHLVADAWTFGLMANEVDAAYHKLVCGEDSTLAGADYADYIQSETDYLTSNRYAKDKSFWEEKYVARPEESTIKVCPVPVSSIAAKRITRTLPFKLEEKIEAFCKVNSVTPAVLFETALITYLAKINAENQTITISVPVLNRSNAREKKIAGMFISTMPLTVAVTEDITVAELASEITRGHMELFRHQKYPYADILRYLREKQNFSGNLYDAMISYQNAKTDTGATTKWYSNGYSEVPFVLHIDNRDQSSSHTLNVDYQVEVFKDEAEVEALIDRLEYILEQVTEDSEKKVKDICIVPEPERNKVIEEFNDTYVDYPREKCVHELFVAQAERTPESIAVVFQEREITYWELDEMSNILAHMLCEKGIGRGDIVPIIAKRSWHILVAMLGILKAGAGYMPVSPDYPKERVQFMVKEAKSKVGCVFGYAEQLEGIEFISLDEMDFDGAEPEKRFALKNQNSSEDICYVIYTSGSTGVPKGVVMAHRNLNNFVEENGKNKYQCSLVKNASTILSTTSIVFDIFAFEIFSGILHGLKVVLSNENTLLSGDEMGRKMIKLAVDAMHITPTKLKMLIADEVFQQALRQVKILMVGAEVFSDELYRRLRKLTSARIFNGYGPTETTIGVSFKNVTDTDITIGTPIANTQIYILDKQNNPVPIGVPGELCIAGDGVGLGYLNRPELTAEKFVPNPFATKDNHHGAVMYYTGDLARWRTDGEIEYLGRMDTQVKIRGLRIELGEIESVMAGFPGIALCAVTDKKDSEGRQYLVGYYTVEGKDAVDEKSLREHLLSKLPNYMVPNYFMCLDAMPMTPSGKTDRKNLPVLELTPQNNDYIEPVTDIEKRLAQLWEEQLHMERVGKTDDFFALGGDSLLAISMLAEIENEFHVEISMKDMMEQSALEQLALCIEQASSAKRLTAYYEKKYVLLPQQKAIYAACSKNPEILTYNMPAKISLSEKVDRNRLKQSISRTLEHHKLLKSYIQAEEEELYGIYDEAAEFIFEEYNNGEETVFVRPFDLGKAPLIRIGFTEDALLFDMHHIVADGESLNIILRDIVAAYEGNAGKKSEVSYADYARFFYELDTKEHKAYFREMLNCEFEPVALPETKHAGQGGASKFYQLPKEIFQKTKRFAKNNGLTDTMVFLGAYGILLSKYTSEQNILSSIVLQNRVHSDTRDMVGMFVNTLPIHMEVKGTTADYMQTAKQLLINLFRYQELPFWEIANAVGMSDKAVVNTSFVYQGDGEKALTLHGQRLLPEVLDTHTAKFDLTMELTPSAEGCKIRMEYNCAKYDEALMDNLVAGYIRILSQLNKEELADISVLSEEEYHKVIEEFNDTYVDYPREKCVHELFMEQAERTPEKVALIFEDKQFSYRELDELSNGLALALRRKGVTTRDYVGVLLKRDERVILAQLAVLKLGAVFIPIDTRYPEERINYIVGNSNCKVLVKNRENCFKHDCVLEIEELEIQPVSGFEAERRDAKEPCYIIFTSGSTGEPKGCVLTNQGLVNFCRNNNILEACSKLEKQVAVSVNTISFDFFIAESLLPLINGYTVVLANEEESVNQEQFHALVKMHGANIMQTTPTRYQLLFGKSNDSSCINQFDVFVTSGEALSPELLQMLHSNKHAKVFNPLGPSECSVWVADGELPDCETVTDIDITIGTPIANTQIYILDKQNNPVPIGVPGELCIAGEGVGLGYLNRPELTAEKFVLNPFATKENHHGAVMYHTGDLACWRTDGEIEYLGRIDTQVKIRGLRIELGEIESVMAGFPGIALCAVADKKDSEGRQYLVGYYTVVEEGKQEGTKKTIDEKKLREHLLSKLPNYMVPNYFMCLETMPMTPSGKTDRKNLPVSEFTLPAREYVAPTTEPEKELCHLLEDLLQLEKVGITDDFFELGGDSLAAIEYMAKAHSQGVEFALQNVYDYRTVQSLCELLERGTESRVEYAASDFEKYQELLARNVIDETFEAKKKTLGNVLLTGATGFLGAHVLAQLMKEEDGTIYCLVRSGEKEDRRGRLLELLQYYFGNQFDEEIGKRIIPVVSDIEQENLAEQLPTDVQTVIHTAASVKHYGSYEYFHRVNVEGTRHVIDYAKSVGAKLVHISTLSVSGNSLADDFNVYRSKEEKQFFETSLYIGQPLDNVYIHSKFEAEMAVYDAMLSGLDAKVIRVGNLTNRASDFKFQPNFTENAFLTRVKAVLEFGLFPDYLMPLYAEFSPIDLTAEGIVKIAQYAEKQCVFHLNSNRPIYFDRFLEVVHDLGISMKVVDGAAFNQALQQTIKSTGEEYIFEAFQNDMDEQGRLVYDSNIRIRNEFTDWFLKKLGFEWNETDLEYIRGYVEYFREIGYLRV